MAHCFETFLDDVDGAVREVKIWSSGSSGVLLYATSQDVVLGKASSELCETASPRTPPELAAVDGYVCRRTWLGVRTF